MLAIASVGCLLLCVALAGCPFPGVSEMLTPYDLEHDPDGDGTLATARPLTWHGDTTSASGGISVDPANMMAIQSYLGGQIIGNNVPPPSEVDTFALGPLEAGDQISADVSSLVQQVVNLTPLAQAEMVRNVAGQALILVDADSNMIGYPGAEPITVEHAGDYYLVVQSFVPGDYDFTVTRKHNQPPMPTRRGVCLLQFGGGSDLDATFLGDQADLIHVSDLPPFELSQARPDFAEQTERFEQCIRQFIEYIYADYDVLVTLDADEAKAAGHYDMVVFTTPSPDDLGFTDSDWQTLGVEPTIDVEDRTNQVGIIFIASFEESRYLDFNSYAALWASVAAHEYGHAIGLWHVRQDSESLMTPSIGGVHHARELRQLKAAEKQEARVRPVIRLIQDPDIYLPRVLGRRDPAEAAAIRERTRQMLPGLP